MTTITGEQEHEYISGKDRYLKRLRRIEGQARGVSRMIDEEQRCIDILTQISARTSALQSVAGERIREASEAIARLVR